ncbi:VTT domain-containing protein [Patescibacteria group bacterium]|nr:VTT domain-containing protein [Patescibacteria group bacterium]MBU1891137.1 VTT domain-containing protein [Patescibacteria group bacterium]
MTNSFLSVFSSKKIKFRTAEWLLVSAIVFVIVFTYVIYNVPAVTDVIESFWSNIETYSYRMGYLGSFIMSWLANSTIIIPFPYTALIFLIGASGLNPIILGICAGIGATLGESVSYIVGYLGHKSAKKKYEKNMAMLRQLIERRPTYTLFFLFLIGGTPIPDDVFLIPLGLIRYNIFKAIIPFAIGKIILVTIYAYAGKLVGGEFTISYFQEQGPLFNVISLVSAIVVIYLVLKIDWEKVSKRLILGRDKPVNKYISD